MSKIPISIRLEEDTINLLKVAAMQEGLRRGNYDLNYINLIEEAIHEAYDESLFKDAKIKISENSDCLKKHTMTAASKAILSESIDSIKNMIKNNKSNGKIDLVHGNVIDKSAVDNILGINEKI